MPSRAATALGAARTGILAALAGLGCGLLAGPEPAAAPAPRAAAFAPRAASVAAAPPDLVPYTVQRGDTLWSIGQRVGADVDELARWNDLADPDVIEKGAVLRVPPPEKRPSQSGAEPSDAAQATAPPPTPEEDSRAEAEDEAPETAPGTATPDARTVQAQDAETAPAPRVARRPDAERGAPEAATRDEARAAGDAARALALARTDVLHAEARFWAADYEAASAAAEEARTALGDADTAEARSTRARAALWSGMALAALGREDEDVVRFRAALADDPTIRIPDPPPPRLERLFETARETRAGA